jgi:hypothetical protein
MWYHNIDTHPHGLVSPEDAYCMDMRNRQAAVRRELRLPEQPDSRGLDGCNVKPIVGWRCGLPTTIDEEDRVDGTEGRGSKG